MLSQLLEKQRKLIAINDSALRVAKTVGQNACSVFQGLPLPLLPRDLSREGCQASNATVEVVGVCLKKNQSPKIQSGPEIFCPRMDLSSWLHSSLLLLTAAFILLKC